MKRFEAVYPDHPKGGPLYLATQFRRHPGGNISAYLEASSTVAHLFRAGVTAFSPISYGYPVAMLNGLEVADHEFWMNLDRDFMRGCRALIMLQSPGYKQSDGMREELKFFEDRNSPVYSLDWPLKKLKDDLRNST